MNDISAPLPHRGPAGRRRKSLRFDYVPRPGLLKLTLVNLLLNIVTLTIYRFWARTNVRKHIWACVHINGQPLEYTGKGIELFKGALIVFACLACRPSWPFRSSTSPMGPNIRQLAGIQSLVFLIVSLLWGAAHFPGAALSAVAHPVARHPRRTGGFGRHLFAHLFRRHAGARHDTGLVDAGDEPQPAGTDHRRHALRRPAVLVQGPRRTALPDLSPCAGS